MDAVDSPPRQTKDAFMGQFVVISIDPVASVADMKDDIATAAASKIPRGKYLALIKAYSVDRSIPYINHPLSFELIGVGHGLLELPYACIPLSPGVDHPEDCSPLLPQVPLPWPDCYLHILTTFEAMITRLHPAPPTLISAIPDTELLTVIRARNDAELRAYDEAASEFEDDGFGETDVLETAPGAFATTCSSEPSGNSSDKHEIDASSSAEDSSSSALSDSRFFWEWPRKLRPRAELWCDLSSAGDFDQPSEILDIMDQLKSIEDEWARRAAIELLVDRPRTSQWAEDVANAGPPAVGNADSILPLSRHHDEEIAREDAIEHRNATVRSPRDFRATAIPSNARMSSSKDTTSTTSRIRGGVRRALDRVFSRLANRFSRILSLAH